MKKETAVEWLFAHLLPFLSFSDVKEREHFRKCLEESKAIEKEQISQAYTIGVEEDVYSNPLRTGEMYYNETFK